MICPNCHKIIDDDDRYCSFCGYSKRKSTGKNIVVDLENKNKEEKNSIGYITVVKSWKQHALIAIIGYALMYAAIIIFGRMLIRYHQSLGVDFSCIAEDWSTCPVDIQILYTKISTTAQVLAELLVIVLVAFIFRSKLKKFFKDAFTNTNFKVALSTIAVMYVASICYNILLATLDLESSSTNQNYVSQIICDYPLLGFLFVVVAAPLFEEIIFRFGVFRSFTESGNKKLENIGVVVTSLLFAGIHLVSTFEEAFADFSNPDWELLFSDMLSLPTYLIGAFALTLAYKKTKKLSTSMLTHMIYNSISFFLIISSYELLEEEASTIVSMILKLFSFC